MIYKLKSNIMFGLGILIGIIIVSTIRHGEMNWIHIGRTVGLTFTILFFIAGWYQSTKMK